MSAALPSSLIDPIIEAALREDFGRGGDITSLSTIPENKTAKAVMRARQDGVVCGIDLAARVFALVDPALTLKAKAQDGDAVSSRQDLLVIEGPARSILGAERVALNFISHLSGIASATAELVKHCEGTKAQIADTRKTTPNLRALEKYAVRMGGGMNHRLGLDDAVLIKDNHIAVAGSIAAALDGAQDYAGHMVKIEIEVDTLSQLQEVLDHGGADIVMLDNFSLDDMKQAVDMAENSLLIEASGNITLDTVRSVAETGVNIISSGWITHSAPILDIGLDIDV